MSDPEPIAPQTPAGPPKRPWWVKVFIAVAILAVLFVVLSLAGVLPGGPGSHGPGRHMPGGGGPVRESAPAGPHEPLNGIDHSS